MKVITVEPERKSYEMELEDSLGAMQHCVGGLIQAVFEPGGREPLICSQTVPIGCTLTEHRKTAPIGSLSAFWHVPPAKRTLLGLRKERHH